MIEYNPSGKIEGCIFLRGIESEFIKDLFKKFSLVGIQITIEESTRGMFEFPVDYLNKKISALEQEAKKRKIAELHVINIAYSLAPRLR